MYNATVWVEEGGKKKVHVFGSVAEEVEQVAKALTDEVPEKKPAGEVDHVKTFVARAKSHRLIAGLLIGLIVVVGVAQFTDAINKIYMFSNSFFLRQTPRLLTCLARLAGYSLVSTTLRAKHLSKALIFQLQVLTSVLCVATWSLEMRSR